MLMLTWLNAQTIHWLDTLYVYVGALGLVCSVGIGSIVGVLGTALGIVCITHVGAGNEDVHTTWGLSPHPIVFIFSSFSFLFPPVFFCYPFFPVVVLFFFLS